MGAYLALVETYGLHYGFYGAEFQGVEIESAGDFLYHPAVLGGIRAGVCRHVLRHISLQIFYDAPGDEFLLALAGREVYEWAGIDERRTGNPHVHLPGTHAVQQLSAVPQLGSPDYAVVTEKHPLSLEYASVGNEFHLCDQVPHILVGRHKGPRPGRRVLVDGPHVRGAVTFRISYGHSYSAVRYAAGAIHFDFVLSAHKPSCLVAHLLDILAFVGTCREAVIYPEE